MGMVRKLLNTFRRSKIQEDAADELAFHLEERTRENMRRGMGEQEARLAAQRKAGNLTGIQEKTGDSDVLPWLDSLGRDSRLALRSLRRSPLFASVTILSLALGIGANTVVFTVMKHLVMDLLPVPEAEQLVILHSAGVQEGHTHSDGMLSSFSYPQYRDLRAATKSIFSGILARFGTNVTLEKQTSERVNCELVSGNYFDVLGVKPWRGRLLGPTDDEKPGGHPVAVLAYKRWQGSFGGNTSVVGQTIRLNRHPYVVVGIAPPAFYGVQIDSAPDVFVPMMMKAQITPARDGLMDRLDHWATLIARLKLGVGLARAQIVLATVYPHIRDQDLAVIPSPDPEFLREFRKTHVELSSGGKGYADTRNSFEKPLQFIGVMVAIVLLITVVNVANLLIARGAAREREMAVRLAVGAGKPALLRQVLVESTILAGLGGLLGVILAFAATPFLFRWFSSSLSESSISSHPDGTILLTMAATTILAGIAFGLLPGIQSSATDVSKALKSGGATGHTAGRLWLRRALVGAQIAFSSLLLTGAMLFTRSLRNVQQLNPGFRMEHLITFKIDPSNARYSQARIEALVDNIRDRLKNQRDVRNATVATSALLEGDSWGGDITVEGSQVRALGKTEVLKNGVTPGFFKTLHIALLAGRVFNDHDSHSKVAIVNTMFAKHFLAGANPVGKHFQFGTEHGTPKFDWTIVGLAADSQHVELRGSVTPFVYMPYLAGGDVSALAFYVRSSGDDTRAMEEIRATMKQADPTLPLYDFRTVDELIAQSLSAERGIAALSTAFAILAIGLAALGLYGVAGYSVARRRREFGIRIAVGGTPGSLLGLVLRETAWIAGAGLVCAAPLVFSAGRIVRSALYGVQPYDPGICVSAALLLFGVALSAGLIPARNAARTDPNVALRAD